MIDENCRLSFFRQQEVNKIFFKFTAKDATYKHRPSQWVSRKVSRGKESQGKESLGKKSQGKESLGKKSLCSLI